MPITLEIKRNLRKLKSEWVKLYNNTPEVSPFLSYDAIQIILKYFFPYSVSGMKFPLICIFRNEGKIVAIAPIVKQLLGKGVELLGNVNGFNECGILYESSSVIPECLRILKDRFGTIKFGRIDERTPLAAYRPEIFRTTKNVVIEFGSSFEDYFSTLSKSVRQNVRTAYNRINKDGLSFQLSVYSGNDGNFPLTNIIELYCRRHEIRYGVKTSRLKRLFLRNFSFATRFYKEAENALTFCLYIHGELAGFMSGLFVQDRLIVPRLSINDNYLRYSPGMLLVCESIKYLIDETKIRILDLSQGEEQYKYQLGGKEHLTYHFEV